MIFRDFQDVVTWALTLALTGMAMVASYFVLVEVIAIVREFARQVAITSQGRASSDTVVPPEKRVKPYKNRATVNRLIKHFKEDEAPEASSSGDE